VSEEIDLRDAGPSSLAEPKEIDLTDRLRFAAVALAADFGGELTADHAEALVFRSAEGLLARASVTEFVPILAERRARLAVRSGGVGLAVSASAPPAAVALPLASVAPRPEPVAQPPASAPEPPAAPAPTNGSGVAPLMSVPVEDLDRLRDQVDQLRMRVADWRAELARR
jgi:hypothetical protein